MVMLTATSKRNGRSWGVGRPGMKQDVERTCGKVTHLKRPRVERTVNDENDYGDEKPEQIFMVSVIAQLLGPFPGHVL
jgi:hypothetical protein